VPVVEGRVDGGTGAQHTGDGDEGEDRREPGEESGKGLVGRLDSHVERRRYDATDVGVGVDRCPIEGQHDVAVGRQPLGDGTPDAARRAGHHDGLGCLTRHVSSALGIRFLGCPKYPLRRSTGPDGAEVLRCGRSERPRTAHEPLGIMSSRHHRGARRP